MNPVLLEWGKKPKSRDKHVPLAYLDPETRQPVNYATARTNADFEGAEIGQVMADNNMLVKTAQQWSIKLKGNYEGFLEVGLRLSQQLDGRFRELTRDKYAALYRELEAELLNGVLAARKQKRDAGLESLLAETEGVTEGDIAKLKGYIAMLKDLPINRHEKRQTFSSDGVMQRLSSMRNDQTLDDAFVKNCRLVEAELRADYVSAVEVAELHGSLPYSLHDSAEEVRAFVYKLGIQNGRPYLKVLKGGITHAGEEYEKKMAEISALRKKAQAAGTLAERFEAGVAMRKAGGVDHPVEFYDELNRILGPMDVDAGFELFVLSATQDAGIWLSPYDIPNIMDYVGKKVLQSSVDALKTGREAFFEVLKANGLPAYLLKYQRAEASQPANASK